MLLNYHNEATIDLLGIGIGKMYPRTIDYIDAFCRYNGVEDMPIGYVYNGVNPYPEAGDYIGKTLDTLINGQHVLSPRRTISDAIPQAYKLYRQLLSQAADSSVVFIAVGPYTNVARLLNSMGDEFSPLTGVELIAQKVKYLSVMGGSFYDDAFNNLEFNVLQDVEASKILFSKWPTPVFASGFDIGSRILYPATSVLNDFAGGEANPLCISYKTYLPMPYDRQTWDLTSVLYAIEPADSHFGLSDAGIITVAEDGRTGFEPNPAGRHHYLTIAAKDIAATTAKLIEVCTGK
jgi:inosine-uridine nucleoside N-ribohydrolase